MTASVISFRPSLGHLNPQRASAGVLAAAALTTLLLGPELVALLAIAALALLVLLPRPAATMATLTVVWFLASVDAPFRGVGVAPAQFAGPARAALLALLVFQGVRTLQNQSVPLTRLLLPVSAFLVVIAFSILLADPSPSEKLLALPFAALLFGTHMLAWDSTRSVRALERLLFALAWAYTAITWGNLLLIALVSQPAFLLTGDGPRFQGALLNPNTLGLLGLAATPTLVTAAVLAGRGSWGRLVFYATAPVVALQVCCRCLAEASPAR